MKLEMKLILLCHVAVLVTCAPKNSSGAEEGYVPVKPLNGNEINQKYTFRKHKYDSGAFGDVYVGSAKDEPVENVVMKLDNAIGTIDGKVEKEVKVYQHLHKKYGDLVQYHLINMLDFGKYKDKQNAIILTRGGLSLMNRKSRDKLKKRTGNDNDWPKICKVMTQVIDAVQHLHRANVVHLDIKDDNVVFGLEPEPVNGSYLPGVTYENDVYLLDLGNSKILKKVENETESGRFTDLVSIERLLCSILTEELAEPSDEPDELPDIETYFDTKNPFDKFPLEIKTALIGYHQALEKLAIQKLTEEKLKKAIDYDKLRSYFSAPKNKTGAEEGYVLSKPLNGTEIDLRYAFGKDKIDFGAFGDVFSGTTKSKPVRNVVMKLENSFGAKNKKAEKEIKVYQHLHKTYGDLVQHHLVNMLDHGKYKDKQDAIIFTQAGVTLGNIESMKLLRKESSKEPNWPKICNVMIQVLDTVQIMHRADTVHLDIKRDNVLFGLEAEPKGARLPGVTYKNDVYLLDLGTAKVLTKDKFVPGNGRFKDLVAIGRLLCSILLEKLFKPEKEIKEIHETPDIRAYFDKNRDFAKFSSKIKETLVGYHQTIKELEPLKLTEDQLATAIDYDKLRSFFK